MVESMPVISVIMSVYSEPLEWIKESIDSILNQTFKDFEFIIINDNPTRIANEDILVKYSQKDTRITILTNEKNIGLTKSLNRGLSVAKGKYIARMDADDISLPERLIEQYNFMEQHTEIGVCGSFIKYFGAKDTIVVYPEKHNQMFLFFMSTFAHPTVFIRREILVKFQLNYNEELRYSQDYDLWERLYSVTKFHNIQKVLLHYRISEQQISSKYNEKQKKIASEIRRRAFNNYCAQNNINCFIPIEISQKDIINYKSLFLNQQYMNSFDVEEFLYYIYRSVSHERFKTFFYGIKSGDLKKMPAKYILKILYCYLRCSQYKLLS